MAESKTYNDEYKIQAVKLGREIGFNKAARDLGISSDMLYRWNKAARAGRLDLGSGAQTPEDVKSLSEELQKLRQENRTLSEENARLKEENEFLAEASAFFAASRQQKPEDGYHRMVR